MQDQEFSLRCIVQIGSKVHPVSCTMGDGDLFPGSKTAGTLSGPLTSKERRDKENMDLKIHCAIRLHGVVLN
jgi:hypothetical protein